MNSIARNLLDTYEARTPEETQAGLNWYKDARAAIRALARETGQSPITFAGIVAALSPRIRWSTNLDAAARLARASVLGLEMPTVAGFGHNREIAWRIATTGAVLPNLSGPKVRAFGANLSGDEYPVTIDIWMLRAAGVQYANKGNIAEIEETIRYIADLDGITPAQVQAIIWIVMRDRWNGD